MSQPIFFSKEVIWSLFSNIPLEVNRNSTQMIGLSYFWILDCNPLEALVNLTDRPAWSPCQAYKNEVNDCGEGPDTPFQIYEDLLFASYWVCSFYYVIYKLS